MSQLVKRVTINALGEQVWGVLADFGDTASWTPTVEESQCTTNAEMGVGARRRMKTSTGDVVEEVIVEWDAGHSFTFEIPDGIRSIIKLVRETWAVEPAPEGCVVIVNWECLTGPRFLSPLLDIMVKRVFNKMLVENLAGLKYHVETGEAVTHKTPGLPARSVA